MIALSLPEIKDFMNKLLCTDTFGHFLLKEAVILGSVTWSLDGTIQPDFYSSDEADALGLTGLSFLPFEQVRPQCFDLIKGKKDGVPTKPAPEIIYNILGTLGVKTEEAVLIGDSDVDVMTAKNAGLDCIGCEWGFRGREELENAGAKYIAEVPQDIVSICHEINRI